MGHAIVDRRRVAAMSDSELRAECTRFSAEWFRAGYPSEDKMPLWMRIKYLALKAERERRGEQRRLF